jgi:hypothetical protein
LQLDRQYFEGIEMQKTNEFATDQLHLAAFLQAKRLKMLRVERQGRFGLFVFNEGDASELISQFMAGKGTVEPRSFVAAIRDLRSKVDALGNS